MCVMAGCTAQMSQCQLVSCPANVVCLLLFFSQKKSIFVRLLCRPLASQLLSADSGISSWEMALTTSSLNINTIISAISE